MAGVHKGVYYDHSQPQEVFDFVEAYYIIHDYRRVEFHVDESVGFEYYIPTESYFESNYYNVFFDHYGQSRWAYGLFAHLIDVWGHGSINRYFYIGDQSSDANLDKRKWVLLHEFGHVEAMQDGSGGLNDVYGLNQIYNDPYYCSYSWVEEHLEWIRQWW